MGGWGVVGGGRGDWGVVGGGRGDWGVVPGGRVAKVRYPVWPGKVFTG